MVIRARSARTILALAAASVLSACGSSDGEAGNRTPIDDKGNAALEAQLNEHRKSQGPEWWALHSDAIPEKPTKTVSEAKEALATDAELAPLADALESAGLDEDEAAALVAQAAAYNSGTAADPQRARAAALRKNLSDGLAEVDAAISEYEAKNGVGVDREKLFGAAYTPVLNAASQVH